MRFNTMGRTGVQVSVIGLGGNMFGNPVDEAGTKAVIDQAQELGINFVDTAEMYAQTRSEELLGAALQGRRHAFVLASKTGTRLDPGLASGGRLTRKRLSERLEASLKRLRTDFVDIYYFHFPDPLTPLEESLRAAEDLVRTGKVRYVGLSNHAGWQVAEAVGLAQRHGWQQIAVQQSGYSMLDRAVEAEVLPACRHFGVGFVPYSPLAGGFLTGKYEQGKPPTPGTRFGRGMRYGAQVFSDENFAKVERWRAFAAQRGKGIGELALAWLAANPAVCSIIVGNTSPAQVAENAKAADWILTPEEVAELA
ncbi:MAG: aldo/keto reductase [Chloroflexi bacterium]|nr:aldo/keto reductase [Chloroflexota bacterium]